MRIMNPVIAVNPVRESMTPLERYHKDLNEGLIFPDPAQYRAVELLQNLHQKLTSTAVKPKPRLANWMQRMRLRPGVQPVRGIYMWGGVGRGKTYLMDIFFDTLPFDGKLRTHFHRFMQGIHRQMDLLRGQKNPLTLIARDVASNVRVICFDEFYVSDIGDAMIMAGLLQKLFENGVVLVATSNTQPDSLYENGLQRTRFLPAIDLIKQHTEVFEIDSGTDYRLRSLDQVELYHCPLSAESEQKLLESFNQLAPDLEQASEAENIDILGRPIASRFYSDDVIWFDFEQLCGGPRSAYDYVELARIYRTVLLGGIPQFDHGNDDPARRFINLIDEFYDRNVILIASAEVPVTALYNGQHLRREFERTMSRLVEMQSRHYLSRPHRP